MEYDINNNVDSQCALSITGAIKPDKFLKIYKLRDIIKSRKFHGLYYKNLNKHRKIYICLLGLEKDFLYLHTTETFNFYSFLMYFIFLFTLSES